MTDENTKKSKIAEREEAVLKYWQENKVFEKTLEKGGNPTSGKATRDKGEFIFYDGPPFATGTPHYGHILAGTIKDAIPRYKTMRGFHVPRRWGWDCHGLPVENIVEKELGFKTKKDIENYGIENFNKKAKESVMQFADDWRTIVPRLGRFVDMDNDYRTMDSTYTESVWWAFKTLYDKGLIYEGFKSMHICPHCETTLSNFEVTQGYKDVTDISVYAKFKLKDGPNTFLIAWTTTPWTLPGNVALAVKTDTSYVKIKIKDKADELYIIAKSRIDAGLKGSEYEIVEEFSGAKLVGKSYKPVFDYYINDSKIKNRENAWKVYAGDFVTTEDGTGIVHIAPAFGEDDYQLSLKERLPFIQHVGMDGKFRSEVKDFVGLSVKPKEDIQKTDVEILKNLAARGLLFGKEKITHPYPHCWRCDTPLLNYATSSWFVKVTDIKDKLVALNKKVNWVPKAIGEYRFGNWLSEARDWAISRSRFWGAPIPVWRCDKCKEVKVLGGFSELEKPARNKFFVVRHGEAENNVRNIVSSNPSLPHHLTKKGKEQVADAAKELKNKKIDLIFYSPLVRTTETAKIIAEALNIPNEQLVADMRLRETGKDAWDGKSVDEYHKAIGDETELTRFTSTTNNAESFNQIRKRMGGFLSEIDKKYEGKTILVVSHDTPIWLLFSAALGLNPKQAIEYRGDDEFYFKNADVKELKISHVPKNDFFELDVHRPFIDSVELTCQCAHSNSSGQGGIMKRVPEVFDCWFESGSMPYASNHYPFDKAQGRPFDPIGGIFHTKKGYPADFIPEGIDQTRGWFYSMLVLGVALFGKSPFENVVVNGTILAEDGEKMSKRLKNYPDPMDVVSRYGADSLRYYLLSSPSVKGEDVRFSEKGVDEVSKKIIARLDNILSFYNLYKDTIHTMPELGESPKVLDIWIKSRLGETVEDVSKSMDVYEIDKAVRPLGDFIEDLSVWYLRRSRERAKGDDNMDRHYMLATLKFVLKEFSKILAPFTPFLAEHIFQSLQTTNYLLPTSSSVHLEAWPVPLVDYIRRDELQKMAEVRELVSKALELRARANIKVRQPLAKLKVKSSKSKLGEEHLQLIKDELNVKHVHFDDSLSDPIVLDTTITPELKEEGQVRELVRAIQDLRKNQGLTIKDFADLSIETDETGRKIIDNNQDFIKKTTLLNSIVFSANLPSEPIDIGDKIIVKIGLLN